VAILKERSVLVQQYTLHRIYKGAFLKLGTSDAIKEYISIIILQHLFVSYLVCYVFMNHTTFLNKEVTYLEKAFD
jgi:hypothetical protein